MILTVFLMKRVNIKRDLAGKHVIIEYQTRPFRDFWPGDMRERIGQSGIYHIPPADPVNMSLSV